MEYSCKHFNTNIKLVTPCCDKVYTCKYCHNESESHTLKPDEITEIVCSNCSTRQGLHAQSCNGCTGQGLQAQCSNCFSRQGLQAQCSDCSSRQGLIAPCSKCSTRLKLQVQGSNCSMIPGLHAQCSNCFIMQEPRALCENCHIHFARYVCLTCKIFDNELKGQFHCEKCGLCRFGGRYNHFHCIKCNVCLPLSKQNNHKCIENASRSACPICLEDIHTSRLPSRIGLCGHYIHRECFLNYAECGNYVCPICQKSIPNMSGLWKQYDEEVENFPLPESLQYNVNISCNDCSKLSTVKNNYIKDKCPHCGSYNTRKIF